MEDLFMIFCGEGDHLVIGSLWGGGGRAGSLKSVRGFLTSLVEPKKMFGG